MDATKRQLKEHNGQPLQNQQPPADSIHGGGTGGREWEVSITFGTFCSGIGAPEVAWGKLGWRSVFSCEVDSFCNRVRAARFTDNNLGDMTNIIGGNLPVVDVWCAGTPCQAFSVAGLRKGLTDERGNLTLVFVRLLAAAEQAGVGPQIVLWENVPGVLSDKSNAFGCFLAGLVGEVEPLVSPDGKWTSAGLVVGAEGVAAWRILDAQYFGLAQRRRRVFVVRCPASGADPAQILFESAGLRRNTPPRRTAEERVAASLTRGAESSGKGGYAGRRREDDVNIVAALSASGRGTSRAGESRGQDPIIIEPWPAEIASTLDAAMAQKWGLEDQHVNANCPNFVPVFATSGQGNAAFTTDIALALNSMNDPPYITHALKAEGCDAGEDGTGRGTPIIPIDMRQTSRGDRMTNNRREGSSGGAPGTGIGKDGDPSPTISISHTPAVFTIHGTNKTARDTSQTDIAGSVRTRPPGAQENSSTTVAVDAFGVRRLTPVECERLQGFPDNFTAIEGAADTPRYRSLGNSMAVPVIEWLGRRIQTYTEQPMNNKLAATRAEGGGK